jgi:hypothetical protein
LLYKYFYVEKTKDFQLDVIGEDKARLCGLISFSLGDKELLSITIAGRGILPEKIHHKARNL